MDEQLKAWLKDGKHLPEFLRDFHDQKDIFKTIHQKYQDPAKLNDVLATSNLNDVNWVDAHIYTLDWFLWYMASRGYTLQKCRANQNFMEMGK